MAKSEGNTYRPVTVALCAYFPKEGARKVHAGDLEKAALAAATAFRNTLEGRSTPYEVLGLTYEVEYNYTLAHASGKA